MSQEGTQPTPVLGRFYEVYDKHGKRYVGELVEMDDTFQYILRWIDGKPTSDIYRTLFGSRQIREIPKELCFDLSFQFNDRNMPGKVQQ
jgi:hypothetical protein